MKPLDKEALEYHASGRRGKIEIKPTKPCHTERYLSLAYSPGVAAPCKEIHKGPNKVYDYTAKGNLVAVISDGTAVLGLGNIGPLASKPVMEGKGVLFKQFADIDVFDIEVKSESVEEFIQAVKALEPTFGGVNLEDIKAPECFEIEERLKREMNIPVFHDDQHGTAIISGAALINATMIQEKKIEDIKLVVNGAGASAVSCTKIFMSLGVRKENIIMCDSRGVIYKGRTDGMNAHKNEFANDTEKRTLEDAVNGADAFVGLSVGGALTPEMVKSMAPRPIVFAMANPDPEILPPDAKAVRDDIIVATGRSDYPNQVNNVLGFPFIFRGALDVRATTINEEMKLAAVRALAELAREDVPEIVSEAYRGEVFKFGPDYIIPKPFDSRVLLRVAPAVAKAAIETGVAQSTIEDFDAYRDKLEAVLGPRKVFIRNVIHQINSHTKGKLENAPKLVFPEGTSTKILKALNSIVPEGLCRPVLLGYEDQIRALIKEHELEALHDIEIIHPSRSKNFQAYGEKLFEIRQRKGVMLREAERLMADPQYYAAMMVNMGDADGLITGSTLNYAYAAKPILRVIGHKEGSVAAGVNIVILDDRMLFLADTTMHVNPTAEEVAKIAELTASVARRFGVTPKVAMLSYSNFSANATTPRKMAQAAQILKSTQPELIVDGEMQADTAVNEDILANLFPFSELVGHGAANVLVFPNLEASNISYKLLQQLTNTEVLGPFLMGIGKPVHILQRTTNVEQIMNSIAITSLEVMQSRLEARS
jgi:malate dehydrogenase (oxaloacetate-decarboxylating)(NADP+)